MENRDIVRSTKQAIGADIFINHVNEIQISSEDDSTIVLEGHVDTYSEKERATTVASKVVGVTNVVNKIEVDPPEIESL